MPGVELGHPAHHTPYAVDALDTLMNGVGHLQGVAVHGVIYSQYVHWCTSLFETNDALQ
jgi:hypothetical protein